MAHKKIDWRDPRKILSSKYGESHPDCFDNAIQYRQYIWLMRQADSPKDNGYCLDCTPEHKAKMMREGRCEHPETRFVVWVSRQKEPEVIGVSDVSIFWRRVMRGETVLNWGSDGEDKQQG
jgi:hypothetical protein